MRNSETASLEVGGLARERGAECQHARGDEVKRDDGGNRVERRSSRAPLSRQRNPARSNNDNGSRVVLARSTLGFRNRPTRGVHRPPVIVGIPDTARGGACARARGISTMPDPARPPLVVLPGRVFSARFRRALDARRGRARVRPRPRGRRAPSVPSLRSPRGASTRGAPRADPPRTRPHRAAPASLVPLASDPDAPDAATPTPRSARTPTPSALGMCAGPRRRPIHARRRTRLARLVAAERCSAPRTATASPTITPTNTPRTHPVASSPARCTSAGRAARADLHPARRRRRRRHRLGERSGGAPTVSADGHGHGDARRRTAPRARHRRRPRARPAPLIRPRRPPPTRGRRRRRRRRRVVDSKRRGSSPRGRLRGGHPRTDRGAECAEEDGSAGMPSTGADRVGATRRRVVRVAVKSVDAEFGDAMSSAEGTSAEASAEWTSCAMVGAIAAGGPSPGLERFALCDDSNSRNPGAVPKGARDDNEDEEDDELRLSPLAASLVAALAPPLHVAAARALRLRTAILVHGSAGMGKRGAVAAAASALGAAFVPVSCHELVAEGANDDSPPPSTPRSKPPPRTPVVLYLRRFGALAGAASASGGGGGGGGPGEISGGAAAAGVAQSIRKGIAASSADSSSATSDDHDDEEDRAELERHVRHRAEGEPSREGTGPDARGLVVLVAGVEDLESVPEPLRRCFTHEVEATPPTEAERLAILRECLGPGREPSDREDETVVARGTPRSAARSAAKSEDRTPRMRGTPETPGTPGTPRMPGSSGVPGMSLGTSPVATAPSSSPVPDFPDFPGTPRASTSSPRPFSARDLESAAASSSGASPRDVRALAAEAALSAPLGTPITSANLADAVRWSERRTASAIGAPTVPATTWEDVGGLEDARRRYATSWSFRSNARICSPRARVPTPAGSMGGPARCCTARRARARRCSPRRWRRSAPFASSASRVPNSSTCTWARASETCGRFSSARDTPRRAWCSSTSWTRSRPPEARARTAAG